MFPFFSMRSKEGLEIPKNDHKYKAKKSGNIIRKKNSILPPLV